jgi:hypothetical protein
MSRTKDQWLERTGGFRVGESDADFLGRAKEIETLEKQFRSPGLAMQERETVQRRLCTLKGTDFDSPDDDED